MTEDFKATFNCGCCGEFYPKIHQHIHHITPRSAGGKNTAENLISLCPGCHDALHSIAYKLCSPRNSQSQVIDLLHVIYKDNAKAISTCLKLAINVRDSLIKSQEEGLNADHIVAVGTSILKRHKDVLFVKCREMGMSQEEFLRRLILRQILLWTGAKSEDVILESTKVSALRKAQKTRM